MPPTPDLSDLLLDLNPQATTADRHAWLRRWMAWVRGPQGGSALASRERVLLFLDAVQARGDRAERFQDWVERLLIEGDFSLLLADMGFAPRTALLSELGQRLKWHCLPLSPDTTDMAAVFRYLGPTDVDVRWIQSLDTAIAEAWRTALGPRYSGIQALWRQAVMDAIAISISQIVAAGHAGEIRQRMDGSARAARPFDPLALRLEALRQAEPHSPAFEKARSAMERQLAACREAAFTVYGHLEQHGISVGIVFRLRQLRRRILRTLLLLNAVDHATPLTTPLPTATPAGHSPTFGLWAHLALEAHSTRSIRALLASTTGLLAERIAERNAHSGEHYITRNWTEYRQMFRAALGGGLVIGGTTATKFALAALALSPFWAGAAAGLNYAVSFVLVMLLHWTVATKQPAVTAPAMALKLKQVRDDGELEGFVDEVAHLFRSQVAAIAGNLLAVIPTVVALSAALVWMGGAPMIDTATANYVLSSIDLRGPTALFAAFTGVLLFASSLIAGSIENWFVLNRLASGIAHQPSLRRWLGPARATQWGLWLQTHVSGLAANVSLGLLLGLVPVIAQFMGLPLDVRHVTLSAGQLTAAAASLGWPLLLEPTFWWAVAGVAIVGPLNLGVSFYLAFRVALASQQVSVPDRRRIRRAIVQRVRTAPLRFLLPSKHTAHSVPSGP